MEQTTNKKKTVATIIGLAVGLTVAVLIQQFLFSAPSFDKVMMQAASEINESCPIMIDQETRLDNTVTLPDKIFQYNYTLINLEKDSININEFESYMLPQIRNNVKSNPDLQVYRDNEVTMAYYYKDKNGLFLTKISITPDQYKN